MDSYQPLLSTTPWAPGFGNHEFFQVLPPPPPCFCRSYPASPSKPLALC